jgi:hypothetical protein
VIALLTVTVKLVPAMTGTFVTAFQFVVVNAEFDCKLQPAALVGQSSVTCDI